MLDNYGASSTATIVVDITNQLPNVLNDSITVLVGHTIEIDVLANDIDVEGDNLTIESISSPNVKYPQKSYELFAHYGSVSSLLASANESGEVNVHSISHFTTAEYELLNQINQDPIVTEQTLSDIQQKLDYDYVIDLAATANIIISDNGLNLPERFNSINDFMQLPFEISKELGKWRIHNNQDYDNAVAKSFNFGAQNIQIKSILKTNKHTILFEKRTGCNEITTDDENNDICGENSPTQTLYQSRRLITTSLSEISPGEYHFETVDYMQGNTDTGIKIIYAKISNYQGLPIYQYRVFENNQPVLVKTTYLVAKQNLSLFSHQGEFIPAELPLFDPDINTNFKIPYEIDHTGIQ